MTWRETLSERGTHVYFSGTGMSQGLRPFAWGTAFMGVFMEVMINGVRGGTTTGSVFVMQATPILMIVISGAFLWKWRLGGPSYGTLDVERGSLRVSRGFWLGPLQLAAGDIRELTVKDHEQDYSVQTKGTGPVDVSNQWFQVTVVTASGGEQIIACFGEQACAAFFVHRLTTLLVPP